MLKNYIKTAFRNLVKNKFYSLLNISGLALGLATCLLIWLYVTDELSYDRYNTKADRIYRVNTEIKFGGNHIDLAVATPGMGPAMVKELPEVERYTRLLWHGSIHIRKGNDNLQEDRVALADSTFFELFTLPMIEGDPVTALRDPHSMVITEKAARKYFDDVHVVGRSFLVNDSVPYKITGVIQDVPSQSHFNFDFFIAMAESDDSRNNSWLGTENYPTYVLVRQGTNVKRLEAGVNDILDRYLGPQLSAAVNMSLGQFKKSGAFIRGSLTPLTEIHLYSNRIGEIEGGGNIQYVYIFGAIAIFVLLIACVNFMNLSTARSANRAKEVGLRKVMGSLKGDLIVQFLAESILIACTALALGLLIAYAALPSFDALAGKQIGASALFRPGMMVFLSVLVLVVGVLAGSYPAFFLSAFRPIEVLKGKLTGGFKRSWLRNGLVVFQFSLSIVLIIGTWVVYNQLRFIRNSDVGFDRSQVMVIDHTDVLGTRARAFRNELARLSGVRATTMTPFLPTGYWGDGNTFFDSPAKDPKTAMNAQVWTVDADYIPALGMKLLAGRNFSPDFPSDSTGLILNEAAYKFLGSPDIARKKIYGFVKPAGTKLYHIVGVIKNFNFRSLREVVTPLCLVLGNHNEAVSIRIDARSLPEVTAGVKQLWQKMASGQPLSYNFMDESFNRLYTAEMRTGQIAFVFSLLAILIACLGLFGLVTFAVEQRTREIGIRKVLGADVSSIVAMIGMDFLKLVVISSLIAFPVAAWVMSGWLHGFAYGIGLQWWVFALAGVLAVAIALCTVGSRAIQAALANPVDSLRSE